MRLSKLLSTPYQTRAGLPLLLLGLSLFWAGGCAERAPEINTVQPNFVPKSNFEGEWYFQQTFTEVAPETSLGFEGYEVGLEKIRFEITEDYLYLKQSYEPVPGLNESATREGSQEYAEGVVAAFRILSHFDIRRAYNTSTGELSNTTEENTSDRPWYEREYMRVDWSSNRVGGPAGVSFVWSSSSSPDFIRDHERFDPDHFIIDEDYIQFSTQAAIRDGGQTCFFVYGSSGCGDSEVRVRTSLYRVKEEDKVGFKPMVYPDFMKIARLKGSSEPCPHDEYSPEFASECSYVRSTSFGLGKDGESISYACTPDFNQIVNDRIFGVTDSIREENCNIDQIPVAARFGYFRTERFGYDRQLGAGHDRNRLFLANHHNIWRDEEQTKPKPIVYYTNPGYPEDLEKITSQLGNEWDGPFIKAVQLKTGLDAEAIRAQLTEDAVQESVKPWMFLDGDQLRAGAMFQVRRNTCSLQGVDDYLNRFADDPDYSVDLSALIEEATQGEGLLSGNLLKVCAGLRHWSRTQGVTPRFDWQQLGDLRYSFVNWVFDPQPSGPLGYGPSAADPETGRILKGNANVYGAAIDTYARSAADIIRAMNEDLSLNALLSGSHYREWFEHSAGVDLSTQTQALTNADLRFDEATQQFDAEAAYGAYRHADGRVDVAALQRHLRARLSHPTEHDPIHSMSDLPPVADERLKALRADPMIRARALSDDRLALLRPLYGLSPDDSIPSEVEEHAVDLLLNPAENQRLHEQRTEFFAKQNMMMADFVDDSVIGFALELKGVDSEEVYRMLREEIYRAVMLHEIGHTLGLTHNFAASFDALNFHDRYWDIYEATDDQDLRSRNRIEEYRYTSIMDYGSRFNSDLHGLGKYDHAAIHFVYSGQLQVEEYTQEMRSALDYEVLINGYEAIPALLDDDLTKLRSRQHRPLEALHNERLNGLLNNSQVIVDDVEGALVAAGLASGDTELEYEGLYYKDRSVPYKYCADFYNGNLECKTWDEGASHFDVVKGAIQNYWNYFIFNHYRQGRSERSFIGSYNGREGRLGSYISYPFRFYYFYQYYDLNLRLDLYRAAVTSLNFISQVLGAPEPGKHCWDESQELYRPAHLLEDSQAACEDSVDVPLGVGRPFFHRFNDEYYYQLDVIGSSISKYNLLFYLTDTSSQFFRIANVGDTRAFSIGYYRIYRDELIKLVSELVFNWIDEGSVEYEDEGSSLAGQSIEYLLRDGGFEPAVIAAASAFGQSPEAIAQLPRVAAPMNYDLAWFSVLLNTVFNTSTFDGKPDFVDHVIISELGSSDDRTPVEDRDTVIFTHPHTGVQYRAIQTLDGLSISYELLRRANLVVSEEWSPAKAELESDPNDPEAQARFSRAERRLGRYSDFIQDLRVMRSLVDYYDD